MKKLLTILASASIATASPLTVIACKTQKEIDDQFDYQELLNRFIADVAIIFQKNINDSFSKYSWVSEFDLPWFLTIKELTDHKKDVSNPNSDFYKTLTGFLNENIPDGLIKSELQEEVVNNINYNPILVDKTSPLKSGITIENINFLEKGENITLGIEIATMVSHKRENGEVSAQKISTYSAMNIFLHKDDSDNAKKMDESFSEMMNKTYANDFVFQSDKGNLENTTSYLTNKTEPVIIDLKNKISTLSTEKIQVDVEKLNLSITENSTVDASRFETVTGVSSQTNRKDFLTWMYAYLESDVELNKTLNNIKGNGSLWLNHKLGDDNYTSLVKIAIRNDPTVSEAINTYNLEYNLISKLGINGVLNSQNSKFKINHTDEKTTIAIFGAMIKGASFKISGESYDFTSQMIAIKQKTTFKNTLSLYDEFVMDAFNFQKEFSNLKNTQTEGEYTPNLLFYLDKPESWDLEELRGKSLDFKSIEEDLIKANPRANEYAKRFDLSSAFLHTNNVKSVHKELDFLYINQRNELFFYCTYNNPSYYVNDTILRTYFFSSGLKDPKKFSLHHNEMYPKSIATAHVTANSPPAFLEGENSYWIIKE